MSNRAARGPSMAVNWMSGNAIGGMAAHRSSAHAPQDRSSSARPPATATGPSFRMVSR